MKHIFALIITVITPFFCHAQDDLYYIEEDIIPKKSNTIMIDNDLVKTQNLTALDEILFNNGFGIHNKNNDSGSITTTEKPFKHGVIKLMILVKDNKVLIKGQYNINISYTVYGVTSETDWQPVQYLGTKKSPSMKAWDEIAKVAEAIPGSKKYLRL